MFSGLAEGDWLGQEQGPENMSRLLKRAWDMHQWMAVLLEGERDTPMADHADKHFLWLWERLAETLADLDKKGRKPVPAQERDGLQEWTWAPHTPTTIMAGVPGKQISAWSRDGSSIATSPICGMSMS